MNIIKKIWYWNKNTWWYPLKNLKKYNFTKLHLDSVLESFDFKPYDYTHIWRVERAHLIETKSYFQISNNFDHTDDIKYIDICINLLDILLTEQIDTPERRSSCQRNTASSPILTGTENSVSVLKKQDITCLL